MFETIGWHIILNAKSKEKAHKVIKRLSQEIGEIEIISLEQYWKDKTKYELTCKSKLQIKEPEMAVFYVLQLVNQIAQEVKVIGPIIYEENHIEFEGVCSSPKIVGLSWFNFYIDNFR